MKKAEIRQHYKDKRASTARSVLDAYDQNLKSRYMKFLQMYPARDIHSFIPIPGNNEVDTWLIINQLWKNQYKVITSICKMDTKEMINFEIDSNTNFEPNRFGVPEPTEGTAYRDSPDHILIPLMVCDKFGNRVGYGQGFYDRFLERHKSGVKIGLCHFEPISSIEDIGDHDVKLDYCITPGGLYRFTPE